MKVSIKTIQKIMSEVCERRDIDGNTLEYYTDIEKDNEYIVRAYDPKNNRSYLVVITKPKNTYTYTLVIRTGRKMEI